MPKLWGRCNTAERRRGQRCASEVIPARGGKRDRNRPSAPSKITSLPSVSVPMRVTATPARAAAATKSLAFSAGNGGQDLVVVAAGGDGQHQPRVGRQGFAGSRARGADRRAAPAPRSRWPRTCGRGPWRGRPRCPWRRRHARAARRRGRGAARGADSGGAGARRRRPTGPTLRRAGNSGAGAGRAPHRPACPTRRRHRQAAPYCAAPCGPGAPIRPR